jgi:hypothetical protein
VSKAKIFSGVCGFTTEVEAVTEGRVCKLTIESECNAIQKMASNLTEVDPFQEISFRRGMPQIHAKGHEYCTHAACPVPVGIVKAVEVASGLALPKDVTIEISK